MRVPTLGRGAFMPGGWGVFQNLMYSRSKDLHSLKTAQESLNTIL